MAPVELALPFDGRWLTQNSPARRVPSHGTDRFAARFAIDFVGVDERRRTADRIDWRTLLATEPVERFVSFGRPILAPVDGVVVRVHTGEPDHSARRSQLALISCALGQASRVRSGVAAVAGNHVVIALHDGRHFVALAHLRAGSVLGRVGDVVTVGRPIAACGNSGNSTQPHLHLQVMDGADPAVARGVPMTFRHFREWPRRSPHGEERSSGVPIDGSVIEPVRAAARWPTGGRVIRPWCSAARSMSL
ncbi:MAG: M23 family metallopeptidase [Actinobacteria bacterium]|nr:M23 family metallopeptidase [Actinomycetota bacterium]